MKVPTEIVEQLRSINEGIAREMADIDDLAVLITQLVDKHCYTSAMAHKQSLDSARARLQKLLDQKRFYCTAIRLNEIGVLTNVVARK